MDEPNDRTAIDDALQGLRNGDFSRLEPLFVMNPADGRPPLMVQWHEHGAFAGYEAELAEALTCACFLGHTTVADYFLRRGVDPSGGGATGLNAFHWAANRGQPEAVRLLLRWKAPLDARTVYGGNVLDTAVWSAINEPRPNQLSVIAELLAAGARLATEAYPTGHAEVDQLLKPYHAA